jgi:hypothetical protein
VLGQIGRFLGRDEFQLHASNVCLINSYVKPHFGGRRSVGAFSPSAFSLSQSHGEHRGFSACQHFHSAPLRASAPPRDPSAPRPPVFRLGRAACGLRAEMI